MQKMRLLTFMQMAENKQEIDFEVIQKEMKLEPEEVEAFIIEGVYFFQNILFRGLSALCFKNSFLVLILHEFPFSCSVQVGPC